MTDIPDFPARLLGVREWRIPSPQKIADKLLSSTTIFELWQPGEEKVARCTNKSPCKKESPNARCECGLYAFYGYQLYLKKRINKNRAYKVAGVVSAAGAIEEHGYGFRAQRMQVSALLTSAFHAREVLEEYAEVYGVPLLTPYELPGFIQSLNGVILEKQTPPKEGGNDGEDREAG